MEDFFKYNSFFIDEKALTVINEYKVYDGKGRQIGVCKENRSLGRVVLSLLASKKTLPFRLELSDEKGRVVATLTKGVSVFMSTMKMFDSRGVHISTIKEKFGLKPRFEILDTANNKIGEIKGDIFAWDFVISDAMGNKIGYIDKEFGSAARELFTTADKYVVEVSPSLYDEVLRQTIITIACGLDMILKENNG